MDRTGTKRLTGGMALALTVLAGPALAACGSDAKAIPTTTTVAETAQQFVARVGTQCMGGDPGFDPFLTAHPTPTAADWAAFLPAPLKMLQDTRTCIAASKPPATLQTKVDAVVAALDVVITDFDKALAAAKASNLDETNKWITQMHDIDQPKIDEAAQAVGAG